ncbi:MULTISPECIES: hypothetical protein [Bacillaceae]|jgi:hypothetical protein|uniref:hypothetical protein n=1 Tax=Bacillaceae TaxID=186817 RepID=UPI00101DE1AB|nr:hypothetical protein [Ectobacillus funiculus]
MKETERMLIEWRQEIQQELTNFSEELSLKEQQLSALDVKLDVITSVARNHKEMLHQNILNLKIKEFKSQSEKLKEEIRQLKRKLAIHKDISNGLLEKIDEYLGVGASS